MNLLELALAVAAELPAYLGHALAGFVMLEQTVRLSMDWQRHRVDMRCRHRLRREHPLMPLPGRAGVRRCGDARCCMAASSATSGVTHRGELVLQVASAAYLGRYRGQTRIHTESDLRVFLRWCTARGSIRSLRFGRTSSGMCAGCRTSAACGSADLSAWLFADY